MRAMRPESSFRTMLVPRRPRLRLVAFLVRIWLLNAWPALNLPDAVLRNRLAAARLVLILGMAQLLQLCFRTGSSGGRAHTFRSCSIRLVLGPTCKAWRGGFLLSPLLPRAGEGKKSCLLLRRDHHHHLAPFEPRKTLDH